MRNYNELDALWRAPLFSKAFYQDVALNWRGIAARFLSLLLALTWLVFLIRATIVLSGVIEEMKPTLADFPKITITKGVASSDAKQPYILKDEHGKPVFVFDTTGEVKEPSVSGPMLLMTGTELIQIDARGTVQRHPLNQFPDAVVDQQWLMSWAYLARNALIPAGLVCCGAGTFGLRLLLAVIFAAIGLGLNSAFHGGLTFKPLMRLAVVSMTGPVLLETILNLVGVSTSCWGFVVFTLLAFGYMVFAVKAAAEVVKPAGAVSQMPPGMPPLPGQGQQPPAGFDERFP